jgi:tRNA-modifying protein YgfZ
MSDVGAQYRTIASSAGWIDQRHSGRLRLTGRDRAAFLNALVTNDVSTLTPGRSIYAAYLTPQGRMLADMTIYDRGDHLLVEVAPGLAAGLATRLDQLIFTEDVRVSDVSGAIAEIRLIGAEAASVAARVGGLAAAESARLPVGAHATAGDFTIAHADDRGWPVFDLFLPPDRFDSVVAQFGALDVPVLAAGIADALRIEAGRPLFGVDMNEDTIPLEAGLLDRAISKTKGCYVGQEVIVRVLDRGGGRVAKRLVVIEFEAALDAVEARGAALVHGGQDAGRITSAANSLRNGLGVALGYVGRTLAEPGERLAARIGTREAACVVRGLAG